MKFTGKTLEKFELWARGFLGQGQSSVDKFYKWPQEAQFGVYQAYADHVGIVLHVARSVRQGEFDWHVQYLGNRFYQSLLAPTRKEAQMPAFQKLDFELNIREERNPIS